MCSCGKSFEKHCFSQQISAAALVTTILKKFVNKNIFLNLVVHSFDQSALDSHRVLLIKAVAEKYINVRLYHFAKQKSNKSESITHHSNKIVLI